MTLRHLLAATFALPIAIAVPAFAQSISGGSPPVTATGSTTARTQADRAADVVNILDYGADPTGVTDSTPAFNLAVATVASGQPIRVYVPDGRYLCNTAWIEQGRHVWVDLDSGAQACGNFGGSGAGVIFVGRITQATGNVRTTDTGAQVAPSGNSQLIGDALRTSNSASFAGLGIYRSYSNFNAASTNSNGGDIAYQLVSQWNHLSAPTMFGNWSIAVSPVTDSTTVSNGMNWGLRSEEMNPVNNGPDQGWAAAEGQATWAAGMMVVPDIWGSTGGYGGNIWSAFAAEGALTPNNRWTSYPAQFGSQTPSALSGTDAFTVNGTTISGWTTGNAAEVASKIAGAGIANTSASVDTFGRLVIYMTTANSAGSLVLANSVGTALAKLGLSAGTFTTQFGWAFIGGSNSPSSVGTSGSIRLNGQTVALNQGTGTVADVAAAITSAGVPNVNAYADYQGRLVVVDTAPAALIIANVSGTPLANLGITAGTYQPATPPTGLPELPRTYNGFLVKQGSIAAAGVGLYLGGDITGTSALFPAYPVRITGNWTNGIDLSTATITNNTWNDGHFQLTAAGELIGSKITDPNAAPGAGKFKLTMEAGTNAGTCKLVARAGTSAAAVTIIDNVGSGC